MANVVAHSKAKGTRSQSKEIAQAVERARRHGPAINARRSPKLLAKPAVTHPAVVERSSQQFCAAVRQVDA